jgi:putative hydrolase of the HAD superfamily
MAAKKPFEHVDTWIFDLDNTLYPPTSAVFTQVEMRIRDYIAGYLKLTPDDAFALQKKYFLSHGTSMRGMMDHHAMPPGPYLEYVHDIDVSMIEPNPALDTELARLPGRRLIFTNGSTRHAERIMERLGVSRHFEGIFDITQADYIPKPAPVVYDQFVKTHAINPKTAILIDDLPRNLAPAAALGMTTVWLRTDVPWGQEGAGEDYVHHVADDLVAWLKTLG